MTDPTNSTVNLAEYDLAIRQLFLRVEQADTSLNGNAFVNKIMSEISHIQAKRERRRRSAVQWVATASGIVAAALLPVAIEPLRMTFASWSMIVSPKMVLEIHNGSLMMLVLGLGATAMFALITRRA
jgi:hypothetical protein